MYTWPFASELDGRFNGNDGPRLSRALATVYSNTIGDCPDKNLLIVRPPSSNSSSSTSSASADYIPCRGVVGFKEALVDSGEVLDYTILWVVMTLGMVVASVVYTIFVVRQNVIRTAIDEMVTNWNFDFPRINIEEFKAHKNLAAACISLTFILEDSAGLKPDVMMVPCEHLKKSRLLQQVIFITAAVQSVLLHGFTQVCM